MTNNPLCQRLDLAAPVYGKMKRIRVYLFDEPDTCNVLNINPRNCRNWTEILKHITETIKPAFGAVLRLYELASDKFVETFDELILNETYVALGAYGTVKKEPGMYTLSNKRENFKPRERTQLYLGEIDPRMLDFLNETEKKGLTVIYVMTNGVSLQVPQKVVFRKHELQNWDPIIRFLDQKLDIPEGVEHISTIFGDILLEPRELQHGFVYVAIQPLKPFVELDYLELFKYLCSNYRGNYILSIEPAPIQTSELVRRRTLSEPHPNLRMSEFDIEPRKSRASERKLSTFSKRGSTRDSSLIPKRASTPDKRLTTTSNRMRSLSRSIPFNKKDSSDSLGSRKSTISQTEDNPPRKSVQSTGRQSTPRISEFKINPSTNKSRASISARVSYESKKGRSTSKLGPFLPEKEPEDEWEDELAEVYPMESTVEDKTRSRVSKTRASQTAKHSKSSGILNEDISPKRKATLVITNDIDDNESEHVKPSMYRRGTAYVEPQPSQSVNKSPTSCPVFRDCDCPEKELNPMLVASDDYPRRSSTKAPTSCPVFRNCDCSDESDTNSISTAPSDIKQRRSTSKSITSKLSEKKQNKAGSIASARGDENRTSRSNRMSSSTVGIESDEDFSDTDSVNKEERTTQISRTSQISKGDFRQSTLSTEGFYIEAATSNNRPSENSPAYCPTYKECDCSNISDDFATQTDSRNTSEYPAYQSFSFECNCPEDTVDPILKSCSINPGQKMSRASIMSRQPDESKRRSTKSRQSRRKSSVPKSCSSKKRKQSTKQIEESSSDLEIIQIEYNAPDIYDETTEDVGIPDNISLDYEFDKDMNRRATLQSIRRASSKFPAPVDDIDFDDSAILTNTPGRNSIKPRASQISKSRRSVSKYSTLNIPTENCEDNTEQTDSRRSTIMSRSFAADQPLEEPELVEYPSRITDSRRSIMKPRSSQVSQARKRSSRILAPTLRIASDEDDYNTEQFGRGSSRRSTVKSTRRSSCKTPIDGSRRSIIKTRKSLANNDQDKSPTFSVSIKDCECDDYSEQIQDTRRSTVKAEGLESSSPSPDENNRAGLGTIISIPSEISSMQVANFENVNIMEQISSDDSALNEDETNMVISRPSMVSQTQRRSTTSQPRRSQIFQDQRRRSSKSPDALERENMVQGNESRRSVLKSRPSQILQEQRRRSSKSPAALEREDMEQRDDTRRSVYKTRPSQILQDQRRRSSKSPAVLEREETEQEDETRRSVYKSRPSQILQEQRRRSSKSPAALEREDMEQGNESRRSVFKSRPSQMLQEQRRRSSKSPAALEREDIDQGDESRRSVFKSRPSQILQEQRHKSSRSPAVSEREETEQEDETRRSVYKSRPSQILQEQRRRSSKSPAALDREIMVQGNESRRSVLKSRPSQILQEQRRRSSKYPAALELEDMEQGDDSRRSIFKSRASQILQEQRRRSSKSPAALEREYIEQNDQSRRSVYKSRPSQMLQDQRRRSSKSPAALEREDIEQGQSRRSVFKSRPSQMLQEQRRRSSKPPTALEREDIEQDQSRRSVYKSRPSQILQEQRRRSSRSPTALEREDMEQGNETRRSIFRSRPSQISQAQRRSMILSRISTTPIENDDFEEGLIQTGAPRRSTCKPQKPRGSKSPVTSISLDEYEFNENTEPAPDTRRSTTKSRLSRISQAKRLSSYVTPISNLLTEKEKDNIMEQTSRNINSTLPISSEFPNDCECNNDTEDPVDKRRNNKKFRKSQDQRRSIRKSRVSGLPIENDEIEEEIIQTDATSTLQPERRSSRKPPAIDDFSDEYEPELDTSSRQSIKFRQSLLSQTKRPSSTAATFYPHLENINQTPRRTTSTSLSTGGSVDDYEFDETSGSRRSMIKSKPSIVSQTSRRSTNKIPVSRLSVLEREDIEQGDESRRSVFKSRPSQILQEQRRRSSKSPAALEREDIEQGDESRRSVFKSRPSQILEEQRRRSSKSPAALEREYTEQEDETRRSVYKSRPSQILQEQRRRSSKSPAVLDREYTEQEDESRRSVYKTRPSQILQEQRRRSSKSPAVLEREDIEQGDESRRSVFKSRPSQILQEQRRRSSKSPAALEREEIEQGDESRRSVFKSRPSQILQEQRRRSSKSPAVLDREYTEQEDESRRSVYKTRPSQILQEQRRRSSKSPAVLEREDIEQGDECRRSVFKSRPSQILQEQRRRSSKSPAALEREEIEQGDESRRSVFKSRPSQILQEQRRRSSKSPAALEREEIEQGDESRRSVFKSRPSQILQEQRRRSSKSPAALEREDIEQGDESRRSVFKSRPSQILQEQRRRSSKSPAALEREEIEQEDETRRSVYKTRPSQILQNQRRKSSPVTLEREDIEQEDGNRRSIYKTIPSQIFQDQRRKSSNSPASGLIPDDFDIDSIDTEEAVDTRRTTIKSRQSQLSQAKRLSCKVSLPFSSPIENRDSGDITSNTTNSSSSPSTNSDESGFHGDTEQATDSRRSIIKSRTSQISQAQRRSTNKVPICRFPAENFENEDGSDGKYLAIDSFRKEDTSTRRSTNKSQIIQDPTRRLSKSPNSKLFSDSISRRSTVQSQPNFVSSNLQCFCLSEKSLVPSKNCECIENILKVDSDSCNSQLSNSTPNCSTDINEFQRRGVVTFCSSNISQNPERDCSNVFASSCNNNDGISPMNHLSQISINKCPNFADPSPLQDCGCDYTCGRIDKRRSSKRNSSQDSHNNDPATCPVPVDCPGGPTKPIVSSGSIFQSCNCAENVYNISPSLSEQLDFVTRNCVDGRKNNDCAEDQAVNHCCNQLKNVTEIDKSASCPLVSFTIFCKDQWSSKSSEVGICPCQTSTSIANQNVPKQNRSCCCWLATNENRRPNAEISCIKQNTCRTTNRNQCSKFRNTNENQQISPCFKSHNELWYCFNQDIDNKCTKGINFNKQDNTICKCNQRLLSYSQNSICPSQNLSCYCGKCQNEKLTSPEKICKPLRNQDIVLKLQFPCNEQEKKTVQKVEPIPCNCKEIPIVSESESESQEELEPEPEPEMEPKFEAVPILEFEEEPEAEFEQELDLEPEPEPKEEQEIDMEPEFEEERDAELEQELDLEPEPEPKEELEIEMEPEFEELEPELDEAPKLETQRISNKGPMPAMTTSRAYIKTVTKTSCTCCRHLCCGCSVRYFKCGW